MTKYMSDGPRDTGAIDRPLPAQVQAHRISIISDAVTEYNANKYLPDMKNAKMRSWINVSLQQAGQECMTPSEKTALIEAGEMSE